MNSHGSRSVTSPFPSHIRFCQSNRLLYIAYTILMEFGYNHIKDRIHTLVAKEIMVHLEADQFDHAVKLLLEHYYDR